MARHKKDEGWFELLFWLFTRYPAWVCVPVAVGAFMLINFAILIIASTSPILRGVAQSAPLFGGMAALVVLLAGGKAAIEKAGRRKIYDEQTSIESVRALTWSQFELLIGEAYRRQGYEVFETSAGADGGIDLKLKSHLETVLVQCKHWKVFKVGVKPIRELYGVLMAERADRAIFVTSGAYTQEAMDFAQGKPVKLIDGGDLCRLVTTVRQEQAVEQSVHSKASETKAEPSLACPICRRSMVLRTAKRGENAGSRFWGCSTFPRCKGTRPLEGSGGIE